MLLIFACGIYTYIRGVRGQNAHNGKCPDRPFPLPYVSGRVARCGRLPLLCGCLSSLLGGSLARTPLRRDPHFAVVDMSVDIKRHTVAPASAVAEDVVRVWYPNSTTQ